MRTTMSRDLSNTIARLRSGGDGLPGADDLFELVLELADYVASREDLVRARGRELEPDALARRIFADPETIGIKAVNSLLAGLTEQDLGKLERILLSLEKRHGKALETPPNHRLLVDGAVLGGVGFVYNRKFQEILATRSLRPGRKSPGLLPDLVARTDELFAHGRPRYLWRLGPEFGVDRNVNHLLDRGDEFILRSLYRSRARRLARAVLRWQDLPNGLSIGENCEEIRYGRPVRHLVVRSGSGRHAEFALLLTNLLNAPWEDIQRFYRNRSGKLSSLVAVGPTSGQPLHRTLTASLVILALFTFRNLRTWASPGPSGVSYHRSGEVTAPAAVPLVRLYESKKRAEFLDRMKDVAVYLQELTGEGHELEGLEASLDPPAYRLRLPQETAIPVLGPGQVVFLDREGAGDLGKSAVIYHGSGLTSVWGHLGSISEDLRLGSMVERDAFVGRAGGDGSPPAHLEVRLARRYAEKGFEPNAADILSAGGNYLLDPIGLLVERDSRGFTTGDPAENGEPPRMPSFENVDLFLLEDVRFQQGVLFLSAVVDHPESQIFDPLEEDVLAQVLSEQLEDLS